MTATTGTQTLAEFLLARIPEDEAAARRIIGRRWYACDDGHVQEPEIDDRDAWLAEPGDVVEARLPNHHNSWVLVLDSARVLAECEAKRRIVEHHHADEEACAPDGYEMPCPTLRLLALPYADHPDYREEWRV